MTSRISYLIEDIKRKATLQKWVNEKKELAKKLAYEHRDTIYKRELEDDIKRLDYILPLWEKFKKLRKKSTDYDVLINIDRKGYITLQITFPITKEELDKAIENKSNASMATLCMLFPDFPLHLPYFPVQILFLQYKKGFSNQA